MVSTLIPPKVSAFARGADTSALLLTLEHRLHRHPYVIPEYPRYQSCSRTTTATMISAIIDIREYSTDDNSQGIGAASDAARMERVVSFYERLPRGPAPAEQPRGLLERYRARYLGKKVSAARMNLPVLTTNHGTDRACSSCPRNWWSHLDRIRAKLLLPSTYVVQRWMTNKRC